MSKEKTGFSRRDFLKTAGTAGIGTILSPVDSFATISSCRMPPQPWTRPGFRQLISIFSTAMPAKQRVLTAWGAHAYANRPLPEPPQLAISCAVSCTPGITMNPDGQESFLIKYQLMKEKEY